MKRIIFRVYWSERDRGWYVKVPGVTTPIWFHVKREAVAYAITLGRAEVESGGRSQVVSHRKDGVIQWERTYPRSSDPRRSRG